jgi:hypothetical protein
MIVTVVIFAIAMIFTNILAPTADVSALPNIKNDGILFLICSGIFLIVNLLIFTQLIFITNGTSFGVKDEETGKLLINKRLFYLVLFSFLFVISIYTLLDVFLPDVPLFLPVIFIAMNLINIMQLNIPGLTDLSAIDFYNTFRNGLFDIIFLVFMVIPIVALVIILTSKARKRISEQLEGENELDYIGKNFFKLLLFLLSPFFGFFILVNILNNILNVDLLFLIIIVLVVLFLVWLFILFKLLRDHGKMILTMLQNILIFAVIPLLVFFWILPALIVTMFDVIGLLISGTVFDIQLIITGWETFITYLLDPLTIVITNFLILTLIATFVVGIAEGLSVVSLADVFKTGGLFVMISTLVKSFLFLGVWGSLLYNYLYFIWLELEKLGIQLPPFSFTDLLTLITNFMDELVIVFPIFIPLMVLVLPLYLVIASAFRFFVTSIIAERVDRMDYFMIITSTACVLILLHLLADIAQLGIVNAPFDSLGTENILSFAVVVLQIGEAVFFFLGVLLVPVLVIMYSKRDKKSEEIETKEIEIKEIN